ncbi:MAG: pirin family protein [Candidatus Aramenus sulfurataquae]|jgi:redox-sensitive bicupin YhaK (pirin superfamily)|uniref:Pirin family protein n=3 Tax=Candidatus Aramenus sulfurataquae TaxID=1326980 RepID=A0AAE3FM81_9CREN|nr:pirin family protein [Candidatus Aramenus sulfurataquae]
MIRKVSGVIEGRETRDGAGVKLYRVFGGVPTAYLTDPFLLLDFFGSTDPEDYIMGFPWHPHRGIETVTYLMEGKVEHEDSEGNKGVIYPGDVQWMTAGSGIFHQEMPKPLDDKEVARYFQNPNNNKGLQLWINLPANRKMTTPAYRGVTAKQIPKVEIDQGEVKVVAGEFRGVQGPVNAGLSVDPSYFDVVLKEEGEFVHRVKEKYTVLVYVVEGKAKFDDRTVVGHGNLVIYGEGDEVRIKSLGNSRLIFLSGRPLGEPIAWYGPIVMNTDDQIREALLDLRRGTFVKDKNPIFY